VTARGTLQPLPGPNVHEAALGDVRLALNIFDAAIVLFPTIDPLPIDRVAGDFMKELLLGNVALKRRPHVQVYKNPIAIGSTPEIG